jgi:uncharacterized damage-inducible protein DinB
MPQEVARLADQIRRATQGHAWSGPSAVESFQGVSTAMAKAHPIPGAHSIWELVRHMTVWAEVARRRIAGEIVDPAADENFPPLSGDEHALDWEQDRALFFLAHEDLADAIEALDDGALDTRLVSRDNYTIYITAHGVAQHVLYHTGQIALLKRALGAPPTTQS